MKEATGELNVTVITIVAIAALAAFFYLLIWPGIQSSMALTTACNSGEGYFSGDEGGEHVECTGTRAGGDLTCTYYDASGNQKAQKACD